VTVEDIGAATARLLIEAGAIQVSRDRPYFARRRMGQPGLRRLPAADRRTAVSKGGGSTCHGSRARA